MSTRDCGRFIVVHFQLATVRVTFVSFGCVCWVQIQKEHTEKLQQQMREKSSAKAASTKTRQKNAALSELPSV